MEKRLNGRAIVPGNAEGSAVVSHQPISFWGGISPLTGEIIDRRHDRCGSIITGKVLGLGALLYRIGQKRYVRLTNPAALLAARGRYRGVRAPGWGLTLAAVRYPPGALPPEP